MEEATIRKALVRKETDELLAIACGREAGYSPLAEIVAEQILRDRGRDLSANERELKAAVTAAQMRYESKREVVDCANSAVQDHRLGLWLLAIGSLSFILPVFGYQIRILRFFGPLIPTVGAVMMIGGAIILWQVKRVRATMQGMGDPAAPAENLPRDINFFG